MLEETAKKGKVKSQQGKHQVHGISKWYRDQIHQKFYPKLKNNEYNFGCCAV